MHLDRRMDMQAMDNMDHVQEEIICLISKHILHSAGEGLFLHSTFYVLKEVLIQRNSISTEEKML